MINSPDDAIRQIRALGLPGIFLDIWSGELPAAIRPVCRRPSRFFKIKKDLQGVFPEVDQLVPLWEENLESLVAVDGDRNFLRLFYAPTLERENLGHGYQAFLSNFFLQLIDSGVWDELKELADLFGYEHVTRLMELAEESGDDARWESEYAAFLASIEAE